ncbi:MAG: hypothetical protein ABIH34_03245 [Nanoarchaeota archaeon]
MKKRGIDEPSILKALREAELGLTIEDVAQTLKTSRITAAKYLLILEAKGSCKFKQVGKAKLFYIPRGGAR